MSVTARTIISAKFAGAVSAVEYTVPSGKKAILDKFTATNTDSATQTVSVHLVPNGGSAAPSNLITSLRSMAAGASIELPELKNHILESGDSIAVVASIASKIVIRSSGREVS